MSLVPNWMATPNAAVPRGRDPRARASERSGSDRPGTSGGHIDCPVRSGWRVQSPHPKPPESGRAPAERVPRVLFGHRRALSRRGPLPRALPLRYAPGLRPATCRPDVAGDIPPLVIGRAAEVGLRDREPCLFARRCSRFLPNHASLLVRREQAFSVQTMVPSDNGATQIEKGSILAKIHSSHEEVWFRRARLGTSHALLRGLQ